ncbi:glycosyltransferase [Ectothiorhodospiraceae bacterium WFHF3C12]|nr:glycosyltransferase [Ectothiorhodospiraceae bacterium WFHF3C12]
MRNLLPEFARRGLRVDLLRISGHGPYFDAPPAGVRFVDLGARHVDTAFPALIRYLRRNRPRAMLTDKDRVNRAALWARRLTGVPRRLVVRMGMTVSLNLERRGGWARFSQRFSIRHFYPWADGIVTPSRGAGDDLAALAGLPGERVTVIPNPVVDDALYAAAAEPVDHPWFAAGEAPVVVGAGELSERKDFATLVRAFARVRARRPCRLVILGRGRQREALLALAAELGVAGDVDLPGFAANPYAYMARAGCFAMTSRLEGAGIALIEALALGTPVVSTDCPSGPAETLENGRYGPLVDVGDDQALAASIGELLDAPPDRDFLRAGAARYSVARVADRYLAVLGLG